LSNRLARSTPRKRNSNRGADRAPVRPGFRTRLEAASKSGPPPAKVQWIVGAAAIVFLAALVTIAITLLILVRHHGH
jgi:hypothetical protein